MSDEELINFKYIANKLSQANLVSGKPKEDEATSSALSINGPYFCKLLRVLASTGWKYPPPSLACP